MAETARLRVSSFGLMLLVLVVVLVGVGSTVLVGPAPLLQPRHATETNFTFSAPMWGALFFGPLLVGLVAYVMRWVLVTRVAFALRVAVTVLLALAVVAVLSAAILHEGWNKSTTVTLGTGGSGSGGGAGSAPPANNTTGHHGSGGGNGSNGTGDPGNGSGPGNSSNGTGGHGGGNNTTGGNNGTGGNGNGGHGSGGHNNSSATVPGARSTGGFRIIISNWVFVALAGALSVTVGLLSVPGVLSRLLDRPRSGGGTAGGPSAKEVRLAFHDARLAIESGESPRETIVRLYGRLLSGIGGGVHGLESATPEEIERTVLSRLRVLPERSAVVTRMFEEACYSNHALGGADAERYVQTMQAVEHDLVHGGAAA